MAWIIFLVFVLAVKIQRPCHAWTWTHHDNAGAAPRVSGHSAVTFEDRIFLFGGLRGNAGSPCTQELWTFDDGEWNPVQAATTGPGPRMYSAMAVWDKNLYLLGGWDPGEPKSGGTFLDDIWCLDCKSRKWRKDSQKLPWPVSRHTACTVASRYIVVHTYRGILVFDGKTWNEQATTGNGPEGLSMCAMTSLSDSTVLVFGGSTKTQQLSSDAYILDTDIWQWTLLDVGDNPGPSPRASPCAAQCGDHQAVIFGGASLGEGGYEGGRGLQAQDDTWLLTVGDNSKACWDRIKCHDRHPSARLAATLSRLSGGKLLMQGGWDPKGETFEDTWILTKDEE